MPTPSAPSSSRRSSTSERNPEIVQCHHVLPRYRHITTDVGNGISAEMERTNPEALVKRILPRNKWEKRMRYVRLPGDASDAPYAASAGDFAGIIDRLIDEKVNARRDRAQATIETVYQLFKGTSFLPPPRFQIAEGEHEEALVLINEMEKVSAKLSHEVDLAEHFERVSKYPIYPNCPYLESSNSLTLDAKCEPNDIYDWDWLSDEDEFDLQNCIPWWAPRCVIGHLYVPFGVNCLRLPEQGITDLKKACGGEVTQDAWSTQYSQLLEPFLTSEHIRQRTVFHRLPILLLALPRSNRLVPCLYAAIGHPTGFQPKTWPWQLSDDDPIMPCFVARIGEQIVDDDVFFHDVSDEEFRTFYLSTSEADMFVIGSGVDDDLWEFSPDLILASSADDIPDWLHAHPVQRFLKLTPDSDTAQHFALTRRRFPGRWISDGETVFRPAFPDSLLQTRLRQNTIGAYLLRNLPNENGIFEALKSDGLGKVAAAKDVLDQELSKSQYAFDTRFGK